MREFGSWFNDQGSSSEEDKLSTTKQEFEADELTSEEFKLDNTVEYCKFHEVTNTKIGRLTLDKSNIENVERELKLVCASDGSGISSFDLSNKILEKDEEWRSMTTDFDTLEAQTAKLLSEGRAVAEKEIRWVRDTIVNYGDFLDLNDTLTPNVHKLFKQEYVAFLDT